LKAFEPEFVAAVSVTVSAIATDEILAVNVALVVPLGTVVDDGTVTAELLLERLTISPPLGAVEVSVTVQLSVPAPVTDDWMQLREKGAMKKCPRSLPNELRFTAR
jgi:hypothetical protein